MRTHYAKRFSWPNQSARALQMLGCKLGVLETGVLVWAGLHRDSIRSVSFYRAAWNADAVWMMRKLFLCPSVCQTHALWQNGRKICPDFYTIRKIFNLVFWEEEWLVRGEPFYLKFWVNEGRSQDFTLGHRSWAPNARESRRRGGCGLGRGCPSPQPTRGSGEASWAPPAGTSLFLSQSTRWTDGGTDISLVAETACIQCSAVKTTRLHQTRKRG